MFDRFWIDFRTIWSLFLDADLLRKGSAMKIARVIAASLCEDEKNEAQMRLRQEKCSSREAPGSAEILPVQRCPFPSPPKPPSIPKLKLTEQLQSAKAAFRHPPKSFRHGPVSPQTPLYSRAKAHWINSNRLKPLSVILPALAWRSAFIPQTRIYF